MWVPEPILAETSRNTTFFSYSQRNIVASLVGASWISTYITGNVLCQPLPVGFVRDLLRVVMYPGGSPLIDPNSLHLVNRSFLL